MHRSWLILAFVLLSSSLAGAQAVSLFNGKNLNDWDYDPKMWRVEDGVITGGSLTEKVPHNDFISTKNSYQNFELRLKIRVTGTEGFINSGIQIRSIRVPGSHEMSGYQIDCGKGWFGKIYDESRRNRVIAEPVNAEALAAVVKETEWNEYVIRAEGPRIQTWINGVLAIDYLEQDPNIALDGHIAPQVHSGGKALVQVKDITIEELPATPDAPTWEKLGGYKPWPKPKPNPANAKPAAAKRDISYNDVQGAARTAEEQQKLFKLPPGLEIELVVKESDGIGKFISVYFDQRGRMWTQTALEYPVDANENPAAAEALYAGKGRDKVLVYPREALNAPLSPGGLTNPTVFAEGLAIPLGILPWGNGNACYIQHGHDIKLFKDTNGDGKADESRVILTGFGIQDSHLFPHQFTRAPGGWIWMAQGLFNKSAVKQPGAETAAQFDMCRMARFRPDGSAFEAISTGPNNVWGLVITGEGEAFIQEANDYGYPVMPFHEHAYYPGGTESIKKSYQPDFPPTAGFRMGGTGLSGLALGEGDFRKLTPTLKSDGLCMFVANPITSKVQTIAMHRDGPYWKLEQAADLITCDDPLFRPIAMTNGPDGCIYIVDWYNKIISHNEVPRAHPDRDKTRGRIWRVKNSHLARRDERANPTTPATAESPINPKATRKARLAERDGYFPIPDFTKLGTDELIAMLGTQPTAKAHLAWQTLADRDGAKTINALDSVTIDKAANPAQRIQALWSTDGVEAVDSDMQFSLLEHENRNVRREIVFVLGNKLRLHNDAEDYVGGDHIVDERLAKLENDPNPAVRFTLINSLATALNSNPKHHAQTLSRLLSFAKPSLPGPLAPASRGNKLIPVREAYDREFERFLVRMFLERHPDTVAGFLDSEAAADLPAEARVLASLALDPKASASRVAKLLPQLDRPPNEEELLRLAEFPEEPGVGDALNALLTNENTRQAVAEKLLSQRTKLDAEKIRPLLTKAARAMLQSTDIATRRQALALVIGFRHGPEDVIVQPLIDRQNLVFRGAQVPGDADGELALRLRALAALRSQEAQVFYVLAESDPDPAVRKAAFDALIASSTNVVRSACERLFKLYPKLSAIQRKHMLSTLSGQAEGGAGFMLAAILDKTVPLSDLDASMLERLATVLGDDPGLAKLQQQLGGVFRDVLLLDGTATAWVDSKITLEGPFTVECWVRLAEGISNHDGILGSPGKIDMNFHQSKFRVWVGDQRLHDVVVAQKPITPDLWTHVAITRDKSGTFKLYQNGELDGTSAKQTTTGFENCRIGWTQPAQGTNGAICEFRVWNYERSAAEIRANFDRTFGAPALAGTDGLRMTFPASEPPKGGAPNPILDKGARIAKTIDTPPLLSEAQSKELDAKFARYSALAPEGDPRNGKMLSALCIACHQIGDSGGQIGPNLSGAGAMGLEAVLRNILTPNAAMEPGYRIFRVEMTNGDIVDAFFVSEEKDAVVIRQPGVPDRRIARNEIRSTRYIRRSLMPEGLLDPLPDRQAADLLAYLMTLK